MYTYEFKIDCGKRWECTPVHTTINGSQQDAKEFAQGLLTMHKVEVRYNERGNRAGHYATPKPFVFSFGGAS